MTRAHLPTELDVGAYGIRTIVTGGDWAQNGYVVTHRPTGECVVIDPGGPLSVRPAGDEPGSPDRGLRHVLLTHAHFDHVGGAAALFRLHGTPCIVHPGDVRLLRRAPTYALRFARLELDPPQRWLTYGVGRALAIGGSDIRVIETPGHTEGGVTLAFDGFAFTGDTLLVEHVGRTDLPGADRVELLRSVERLLSGLSEETVLLPGHGRPWTVGEARAWWQRAGTAPPAWDRF